MQIRHKETGELLLSVEADTLEGADLAGRHLDQLPFGCVGEGAAPATVTRLPASRWNELFKSHS